MFNSSPRDPLGLCIPREAETPGNKTSKVCASGRSNVLGPPSQAWHHKDFAQETLKSLPTPEGGTISLEDSPRGAKPRSSFLSTPDALTLKEPERKWRMRKKRTLDPFSVVDGPMTDRLWPGQEKESWFSVYVETIITCYTGILFLSQDSVFWLKLMVGLSPLLSD